jgi:hypothetical protein
MTFTRQALLATGQALTKKKFSQLHSAFASQDSFYLAI